MASKATAVGANTTIESRLFPGWPSNVAGPGEFECSVMKLLPGHFPINSRWEASIQVRPDFIGERGGTRALDPMIRSRRSWANECPIWIRNHKRSNCDFPETPQRHIHLQETTSSASHLSPENTRGGGRSNVRCVVFFGFNRISLHPHSAASASGASRPRSTTLSVVLMRWVVPSWKRITVSTGMSRLPP